MKPLDRLKSVFGLSTKATGSPLSLTDLAGWHEIGSTYKHYEANQYENSYGSIRAISNRFSAVRPYAIDKNGKRIENVAAINALYRPNQQMSITQFLEAIAVTTLVHPEVHLLVWRVKGREVYPGGDITKDNIGGYTFLEGAVKTNIDGEMKYQMTDSNGKIAYFTDDEVITLKAGVNPYDVAGGFSPSQAARRWTRIDDYIADYQTGFFENGAVPAGMFTIVAPSAKEYGDIVANMQKAHKGASKNNNVTYSHTPIDPATGKPAEKSSITWTPFSQSNKDLDLSAIFEQVNQKIDSAFGVPATVRGVNDAVTYASAQVDERNFVINTVHPFVNNIWSQFTHELNRITKGLGYAITFDLDIPQVADEEKLEAETKAIEGQVIRDMVTAGYTLDSIIDSFKLSTSYKNLKTGTASTPVISNDKPDVDEGGEVVSAPDGDITKSAHSHSAQCGHEASEGSDPKALIDNKKIDEESRNKYETQLEKISRDFMSEQIESAIKTTKAVGDPTQAQIETFTDEFMQTVVAIMVAEGAIEYAAGVQLLIRAGISIQEATGYVLSDTAVDAYRAYLLSVAHSYSDDTARAIRSVLDEANVQQLTRAETERALRNILTTDEYRVVRLARTEVNRIQGIAANDSMENISRQTGVKFNKVWHIKDSTACQYCQSLNGTVVGLEEAFVPLDDTVTGVDGGERVNDFVAIDTAQAHPQCRCYMTYEVVRNSKNVKKSMIDAMQTVAGQEIHCKECNRYLGQANGEVKAVIKCSNSKCKADNIIEIGDTK